MALKSCRECHAEVARNAKTCPHCGAARPGDTTATRIGAAVLTILMFFVAWKFVHENVMPSFMASFLGLAQDEQGYYRRIPGHPEDIKDESDARFMAYLSSSHPVETQQLLDSCRKLVPAYDAIDSKTWQVVGRGVQQDAYTKLHSCELLTAAVRERQGASAPSAPPVNPPQSNLQRAELQESCIRPPATVIEVAGVNTAHAVGRGKFTEPDIVKACHDGYVDQNPNWSPEECIRQMNLEILGHELRAEADCGRGTLRLGSRPVFQMPVHPDCASGGIFAAPAFTMLCPGYRGKVEKSP
jgi:hypothetical protein